MKDQLREQIEEGGFVHFDDLTAEDRKLLFGEASNESVETEFRNQWYRVTTVGSLVRTHALALSPLANHTDATAFLPAGFLVTGGGAHSPWETHGNLLTSSYLAAFGREGWRGQSKDHGQAEPVQLLVLAVGIKLA